MGRLLKPLGYSLKTNVKRLIGKVHPQRDRQYRFIQRLKSRFLRCGEPIISVDAKKSELIGQFKNAGARYCRTADVVNTHRCSGFFKPGLPEATYLNDLRMSLFSYNLDRKFRLQKALSYSLGY